MAKDAIINARVEKKLKDRVDDIFGALGLSATEAITLFYKQVELNDGLPFAVRIPNKLTKTVISDSHKGRKTKKFSSKQALYKDLGL
jgi:DNA-damage-inducible protein J